MLVLLGEDLFFEVLSREDVGAASREGRFVEGRTFDGEGKEGSDTVAVAVMSIQIGVDAIAVMMMMMLVGVGVGVV